MKRIETKPCKPFKIDKIKFDANIHLILDIFPNAFYSNIICIVTSHLSGEIVNTTFPVIDEVIWGFEASQNLSMRIVLN